MNHTKRLLKIAEKILADVHFSTQQEFDEYLKNHPNFREDTKFYVNGVQVKAPPKEKNNDSEMTDEQKKLHEEYKDFRGGPRFTHDRELIKKRIGISRKNLHPLTLDMLQKNGGVDSYVAGNPNTSEHTIINIIKQNDTIESNGAIQTARAALQHHNLGGEFLEKYNADGVENKIARNYLMRGVARNPNTPAKKFNDIFEQAKKYQDLSMFYNLHLNENLPENLRKETDEMAKKFSSIYAGTAPAWYDL